MCYHTLTTGIATHNLIEAIYQTHAHIHICQNHSNAKETHFKINTSNNKTHMVALGNQPSYTHWKTKQPNPFSKAKTP